MAARSALIVAVMVGVLTCTPAFAAGLFVLPNGSPVYNSGIDVIGLVDQRYLMSVNPFDPGVTTARRNDFPGTLSPSDDDSGWITPSGAGTVATEGIYRVDTLIDLTGIDPATIVFEGFWVSYKQAANTDIFINGVGTNQTNSGLYGMQPDENVAGNSFSLTAAQGLAPGLNTISFQWETFDAPGEPAYSHVRVEFTGFTLVPLPPAAVLFVPAGVWLLRPRRACVS